MRKKPYIILRFFPFAALIASCGSHASGPAKNAPVNQFNAVPAVEGFVVKPTVIDQSIAISGTLKPFEETVLMPDVAGRVVTINLPEGKFVKQGTLLVKLFDGDLQANLKKSNAQLDIAEQTEKRQAELLKVSGISQSDYDQALLQVHSINADIEVLKAQIRKTEIYAPFDGVIGLKNISIGAQVTPATPIATIRAVQKLKLDFSVPEKYSDELKPGLKVQFTVQGDDSKYDATVMATEEGIDASTRNLNARAVVQNTKALLTPGAFANVELQLKEIKNALMVPTQAIIPQELKKQLIVVKEGKAKFITVQTGVRQASAIQVLTGIASGDTVVTTGILFLKPGMSLKFSKVNN
ncbi:MAG: efflux RND transporter periplasmic adaptor subunit [Chitinivibrionales bacterium]